MSERIIRGCPVGDGLPACPRCQGWLRGITTVVINRLYTQDRIPENLCDPIQDRVNQVRKSQQTTNKNE